MEKQKLGIIVAIISFILFTIIYLFIEFGDINLTYLQYGYGYFCIYVFIVISYLIYSLISMDKKQLHDLRKGRNVFDNSNLIKLVLIVIVGLILLAGSNSDVSPEAVVNGTVNVGNHIDKLNQFNKNGVSFNYSNNWTEVDEDGYLAVLSHNENGAIFQLQEESNVSGLSLDQCAQALLDDSSKVNSTLISSKHIKINGVDAIDMKLKVKVGSSDQQARLICFIKKDKLYSLVFNSLNVDSLNDEINVITSSFKVS